MIYTVKDVARILQIPESTVYEYIRNHVIPSFKIGKHVRVRKDDLDECIERLIK